MKTLEDVLEEITPAPDPDFVADMERRMEMGFPAPEKRGRPRIVLPSFRPRPFVAAAASTLLALMVAVALTQEGRDDAGSGAVVAQEAGSFAGDAGGGQVEERALAAPDATSAEALPAPFPPPNADLAPGVRERRVERVANLILAGDPDEFDRVSSAIFRITGNRGGFVTQSSLTQGEDAFTGGFFDLRVPVDQLQPALNDLSRLATVRARTESGTDVTGTFVSLRDRLRMARALRTSLLRRLELATTEAAVQSLQRRLAIVGNRITGLRSQLRDARSRTEFATITVELVNEDPGASDSETDEALDDAVGSLEDLANFLIRALGVLLPATVIGMAVWFVARGARRRARERSLA
ncbi:MAG TPA: DUF4349 domain-containing protein [Thermoleophilaceae bacterium]|nr:DUF4349 domain-containing protein [Thermoleophilaceae bacterium]